MLVIYWKLITAIIHIENTSLWPGEYICIRNYLDLIKNTMANTHQIFYNTSQYIFKGKIMYISWKVPTVKKMYIFTIACNYWDAKMVYKLS